MNDDFGLNGGMNYENDICNYKIDKKCIRIDRYTFLLSSQSVIGGKHSTRVHSITYCTVIRDIKILF